MIIKSTHPRNQAAASAAVASPKPEQAEKKADGFVKSAKDDFAMFKPSAELKQWAAQSTVTTIPQMFKQAMAKNPDAKFLGRKVDGKFEYMTFAETDEARQNFASGLVELGLKPGERLATYAGNSPEWMVADLGAISAGAVHAPLYRDSKAEAIAFNLKNVEAKIAVVDDQKRLNELLAIEDELPHLHTIIVKDKEGVESSKKLVTWDEVMKSGEANRDKNAGELAHREKDLKATDVASIVFTSGTTGTPKAVLHTHGSLLSSVEGALKIITNDKEAKLESLKMEGDSELSLLPLSHIFERIVAYSLASAGASLAYPDGHKDFMDDVKQTQPTVLAAVPKLYNKILSKSQEKANASPLVSKGVGMGGGAAAGAVIGGLISALAGGNFLGVGTAIGGAIGLGAGKMLSGKTQGGLFNWALDTSEQYYKERDAGNLSFGTKLKHGLAKKLVYSKSRKAIESTLGKNVRVMISGGAPLPDRTSAFFWDNGIQLSNGYGTSEMGVTNVNPLSGQKLGTVGPAVPGVEMAVTPDPDLDGHGEIRYKGPNLMLGYLNDPEKTAKAFDGEGYYLTGDIGDTDDDGHLRITGRLKNYIALASGKKIASEPLEQILEQSPYISQSVVVGESRPHVGALVVPNFDKLAEWAKENGHSIDKEAMAKNPAVKAFLETETRRLTANNDRHEQIWKIGVIERDLQEDELAKGEPKRPIILKAFSGLVDAIYQKKKKA